MAAKKTKKKTHVTAEDKQKVIEEIDIALSENETVTSSEVGKSEGAEPAEDASKEKESSAEKSEEIEEASEESGSNEPDDSGPDASTDSIFSSPPDDIKQAKKGKSKSFLIIVICLCIIFLLAGFVGGYFYGKGFDFNLGTAPAPTPVAEAPTPTPTVEEVDLSAYSIQLLNGSGVAGVAGDEQTALEADGFKVENVGNAETQDFSETSISFKSDVSEAFLDKLKESLAARYVIAGEAGELDSDNTYDVVITLGSETVVDE